jgi:hypothetical protein
VLELRDTNGGWFAAKAPLPGASLSQFLEQEAATWLRLAPHPNVVTALDIIHHNGQPYLLLDSVYAPAPRLPTTTGTYLYRAPEVVLGADRLDEKADVYSLGLVAMELLTVRPPCPTSPRPSTEDGVSGSGSTRTPARCSAAASNNTRANGSTHRRS